MAESQEEPVVANPTYMGDIRYFFTAEDVSHMQDHGIDLGTYEGVKGHAVQIYSAVSPPVHMPPDPGRHWSENRCQSFLNWMTNGYPMGTPARSAPSWFSLAGQPSRIRKDVASLNQVEAETLARAFRGVMAREPDDSTSYFVVAGYHGIPNGWCQHHNDPYNPWHRIYLKIFEDALRTVPGCEEVTLPYWDIAKPIPPLLNTAPFDAFVFPRKVGRYNEGDSTQRNNQDDINDNLRSFDFFGDVQRALNQKRWGKYDSQSGYGYQQFSIQAHDAGHLSTGPTMSDQNVAAYDPIFWLYHCNLDRYWLSWQKLYHALDWTSFQSVLDDTRFWKPPLNQTAPFETTTDQAISFDIDYDVDAMTQRPLETEARSISALSEFRINTGKQVAVRVDEISRLNVPGSFIVRLLADGELVASRAFFQPLDPKECATCAGIPKIGLEFRVDADAILNKKLSVELEVPHRPELSTASLLSSIGNPKIKVNFLLDEM